MASKKAVVLKFIEQLRAEYKRTHDIIRCFRIYLGFLKQFADPRYGVFSQWQREDMEMSIYNPKIDTAKIPLETAWNYTRRGGKTRNMTVLATFASIMENTVSWHSAYSEQLAQAYTWFNMNPFVKEIVPSLNRIRVYNSPKIEIAVLSPGKVTGKEADYKFYDELGWVFKHLALKEYYEASRPMVSTSKNKHIVHGSTPAIYSVFYDVWKNLEELEANLDTKFVSHKDDTNCPWISPEFVEQERKLHADCPWYIDQNYKALFVVYGGSVFNNVIALGDPKYPQFNYGFLDRRVPKYGGVDFNGETIGHYRVDIDYDDQYVYVLKETHFHDLNELFGLPEKLQWKDYLLEVEEGLFNTQFTDQLKRMGLNAIYQEMDKYMKMERIAELRNRSIIIDRWLCPLTYRNLIEAAYDQTQRLPTLEKRTDQHGLDALIHAIHEPMDIVYGRQKNKDNKWKNYYNIRRDM